jgi:hypothetical protein
MLSNEIEEIIRRGRKKEGKEIVANIIYILMRDLHQDYRVIKKMPLCDVLELIKLWQKEQEETKKELNKMKIKR